MVCLYVRIFLAIKQRSNDIAKFGAYTASGGQPATANHSQANKPKQLPQQQQQQRQLVEQQQLGGKQASFIFVQLT